MKSWRLLFSYVTTAAISLWVALFLSFQFVTPAHSQTPPANPAGPSTLDAPGAGDLPPEFASEVGSVPSTPPPAVSAPKSQSSAASAEEPESDDSVDETEQNAATAPAPVVNEAPPAAAEYIYDPTGRRDPFKPYRVLVSGDSASAKKNKKLTQIDPLVRWDIEKYRVVGILWQVRAPKAMIKDPEGSVHTVTKNTKIGRNKGYIASIREGELVVVETIEFEGQSSKETKILALGK